MKNLFNPAIAKRLIVPLLVLTAVVILSIFAVRGEALPASALFTPAAATLPATQAPSSTPVATPEETPSPAPTAAPSPTPEVPPIDFATAGFAGADAPVLEQLLGSWGFQYYKPDRKWTGEDAYELSLFQRWAGVPVTGSVDAATRQALLMTWEKYARNEIQREKLPLEGRYIGVNPGHQSHLDSRLEALSPEKGSPKRARVSGGTRGSVTKVPEYKQNLAIALKLRDKLEGMGARVLMARSVNDVKISNAERARMMNGAGVAVYLSLHCNGNHSKKASGLETLVPAGRGNQTGAVLQESRKFAAFMQAEEIKATGAKDDGFSYRKDLSSLNWPMIPTCLIEMGYMTNAAEDRLLNTPAYQSKLVDGMANAFVLYFQSEN
jgi:N-acetylmuramoyl-L-alanine amidase